MSQTEHPYSTGTGSQQPWSPDPAESGGGGETGGVKERLGEAASQAGDVGRETARDAKEQARDVAHEASEHARGLVDRTRAELGDQAASQQQHLASGLRSLGDELGQMADGTQDPGLATDLVQRTSDATGRAAQWFEEREPGDILREVEDFARRRPGMFIAIAAGAGLLVGRLLRGTRDAPDRASGQDPDRAPDRAPGRGEHRRDPVASGGAEGSGPTGPTPQAFPPPTPSTAPYGTAQPTTGGESYVERT